MDCSICWEDFENSACSLECGHLFHRHCIQRVANTRAGTISCPLCRKTRAFSFSVACVREIFFTSAYRAPELSVGNDLNVNRALQHALQEKATAESNLARARADNDAIKANARSMHNQIEEQKAEISVQSIKYAKMTKERDAALAAAEQLRTERDNMAIRIKALEKQNGDIERQMTRYKTLKDNLTRTLNEFADLKSPEDTTDARSRDGGSTTPAAATSPSSNTSPLSLQRANTAKFDFGEINVSSRHAVGRRQIRPARLVPATAVTAPAVPSDGIVAPTRARALKKGSEILWRGYGAPTRTSVLECVAEDGHHQFSGKGTNQYRRRYTCTIIGCGVVVSE